MFFRWTLQVFFTVHMHRFNHFIFIVKIINVNDILIKSEAYRSKQMKNKECMYLTAKARTWTWKILCVCMVVCCGLVWSGSRRQDRFFFTPPWPYCKTGAVRGIKSGLWTSFSKCARKLLMSKVDLMQVNSPSGSRKNG